jgi:hypothetical protein
MTGSKWRLGGSVLACLSLASALAHAQPSSAQKETARGLMAEGRELREQGDLQSALSRFMAADALMGVPTTGFEMAATQADLGKLVEARETLRRVLALPQSPDDPEPFNEARNKARVLEQRLQSRIGGLQFIVNGVGASETMVVTVDGETVPVAALDVPFRVNPGKHVVVARAGGRETRAEVDALESRTVKVELVLAARASEPQLALAEEPVAAVPPAAPRADEPAPAPPPSLPLATYIGGGVGVAGILVGGVTGLLAISNKNAAAAHCVDGECPRSTWSDLDRARTMATVSTVGFVVGVVGFAAGASALLLREEPEPERRSVEVTPSLSPRGGSLTVSGRF